MSKKIVSQNLSFLTSYPKLNYVLWFVSQLVTGLAFQEWLLNNAPFFKNFMVIKERTLWQPAHLPFVLTLPKISVASWLFYLFITFLFEGLAMDWAIKLVLVVNNVWNHFLFERAYPENHTELVEEVFSFSGIFGRFAGCFLFITMGDWWISSQRALSGVSNGLVWWMLAVLYFGLIISGELLLQYTKLHKRGVIDGDSEAEESSGGATTTSIKDDIRAKLPAQSAAVRPNRPNVPGAQ